MAAVVNNFNLHSYFDITIVVVISPTNEFIMNIVNYLLSWIIMIIIDLIEKDTFIVRFFDLITSLPFFINSTIVFAIKYIVIHFFSFLLIIKKSIKLFKPRVLFY